MFTTYSRAHLLFLSKYEEGRIIGDIPYPKNDWYYALHETPDHAIEKFIRDGLIEEFDLPKKISFRYKVVDIKELLRGKGLKISSRKYELIQRLLVADRKQAEALVHNLKILGCTTLGLQLITQYKEFCKTELQTMQRDIISALQSKDFELASIIASDYKAKQIRFTGIYAKPNHMEYLSESNPYIEELTDLFNFIPSIYLHLSYKEIDLLRQASAFLVLNLEPPSFIFPPDFEPNIAIKDNIWACRAFISGLYFKKNLEIYMKKREKYLGDLSLFKDDKEMYALLRTMDTYEFVYIVTCNDSYVCPKCKKLASRKIPIDKVPELPYEKCTSEIGCRCSISYTKP